MDFLVGQTRVRTPGLDRQVGRYGAGRGWAVRGKAGQRWATGLGYEEDLKALAEDEGRSWG